MSKTAILIGATGLTGSHLLDLLLASNEYEKVSIGIYITYVTNGWHCCKCI